MLYELQVLRNNAPVQDFYEAVVVLNQFQYHLIGQPCVIRYYGEDGTTIRVCFAIGRRSYTSSDYDLVTPENNYEIINTGEDNSLYWQTFIDSIEGIKVTEDKVQVLYSSIEDMETAIENGLYSDTRISFAYGKDASPNRIYLGDKIFGGTDLTTMSVSEDMDYFDIKANDNFASIIEKINNKFASVGKWNDEMKLNFVTGTYSDYLYDFNSDLAANKRNFYEVTGKSIAPHAGVNAYFVGDSLVGDHYISKIAGGEVMRYNVGSWTEGATIEQILSDTGSSINDLLDKIFFPEQINLNYRIAAEDDIKDIINGNVQYDPTEDEHEQHDIHRLISKSEIDDIIEILDEKLKNEGK